MLALEVTAASAAALVPMAGAAVIAYRSVRIPRHGESRRPRP